MKVLIKAGTPAWMIKGNAPSSVTFPKDAMVELEERDMFWYMIMVDVAEFPEGRSNMLINKVHIPSDISACIAPTIGMLAKA